jgi:nucleotide-binding universal stress UspA family protein
MLTLVKPIVAGFDGSVDSMRALEWAVATAEREHAPVRVVLADLVHRMPGVVAINADEVDHALDQARKCLEASGVDHWTLERVEGFAPSVLLRAAEDARLLVVGSLGHGLLAGAVLGSVSQHVVRFATCPVVVVKPTQSTTADSIVVGVDGSGGSATALAYACARADLTGQEVVAVHGWRLDSVPIDRRGDMPTSVVEALDQEQRVLSESIAGLSERYPDVVIRPESVPVDPVRAIVDASANASLVVVGSRGHGLVRDALLGSVSQETLEKAHCSVAVAR